MYNSGEINGEDFLLDLCAHTDMKYAFKAESQEEYFKWKEEAEKGILDILGVDRIKPSQLKAELVDSSETEEYRLDKYILPTAYKLKMPLYVLVPHKNNGKVFVAIHGHGVYGKEGLTGRLPEEIKGGARKKIPFALEMVKEGYITVCPDLLGSGERITGLAEDKSKSVCDLLNNALTALGLTLQGVIIYELIQLVDFALDLKENRYKKVGVCGFSGGGVFAFTLSALCNKVDAVYSSGYFHGRSDTCLQSNKCGCNFAPDLWLTADMGELAAMIAPRPLFIEIGNRDILNGRSGLEGVKNELEKAKKAYALFNKEDNLKLEAGEGGHGWYGLGYGFLRDKLNLK